MKHKSRKPRWGWLYAIFGVMVALFYLETRLALSGTVRIIAQLGVLTLVYYFVDQWLGANMPFDRWS
jgi:hypothetical protein